MNDFFRPIYSNSRKLLRVENRAFYSLRVFVNDKVELGDAIIRLRHETIEFGKKYNEILFGLQQIDIKYIKKGQEVVADPKWIEEKWKFSDEFADQRDTWNEKMNEMMFDVERSILSNIKELSKG